MIRKSGKCHLYRKFGNTSSSKILAALAHWEEVCSFVRSQTSREKNNIKAKPYNELREHTIIYLNLILKLFTPQEYTISKLIDSVHTTYWNLMKNKIIFLSFKFSHINS